MSILFPIAAFAATALLIWGGKSIALKWGYADKPGGRKQHDDPVPPIGGLIILPVFLLTCWLGGLKAIVPWPLAAGVITLLIMGAVDEKWQIKPFLKFAIMVWTASFVVIFGQAQIGNVGNLFGFGVVELGFLSKSFTIMCLVLLMNSINMMDGIDGLAGGFCALVAFWFMVVCAGAHQWTPFWALAILLGSLLGFLMFNLRTPLRARATVFMGDAGALALALILGWFSIRLTQNIYPAPLRPITVVWIIAVPVMDAFALFITRSLHGLNPFNADRRHLHHRFVDAGISQGVSATAILAIIALFAFIGFMGQAYDVPPFMLFYLWMAVFILHTAKIARPRPYAFLSRIAEILKTTP